MSFVVRYPGQTQEREIEHSRLSSPITNDISDSSENKQNKLEACEEPIRNITAIQAGLRER